MTQRCVTEAEQTGLPSPMGSAVKLGYSELGQEISRLGMRLLGRRLLGNEGPETEEARVVHDYLWAFQNTIAAGTSQIQRTLLAERLLGMPKARCARCRCSRSEKRRVGKAGVSTCRSRGSRRHQKKKTTT